MFSAFVAAKFVDGHDGNLGTLLNVTRINRNFYNAWIRTFNKNSVLCSCSLIDRSRNPQQQDACAGY